MGKKYRTEKDSETGLLRIIALKDFSNVQKGDKGGLIEKEENLSQEGDCWVYRNACVFGEARICDNAKVWGWSSVYENARVSGNAWVYGNARVCGEARVYGKAWVCHNAEICDNARVSGNVAVRGEVKVCGRAKLWSTAGSDIYASIENSKSYTVFGMKDGFRIFSSNAKNVGYYNDITIENYIENIQTIRQLYGKEV